MILLERCAQYLDAERSWLMYRRYGMTETGIIAGTGWEHIHRVKVRPRRGPKSAV